MKVLLPLLLFSFLALRIGEAQNSKSDFEALERSWDSMMLNGEFGAVKNERTSNFIAYASFSDADGWVGQILQTKEAIRVSKTSEFLGGGLGIQGGLLRRVEVEKGGVLELYVKQSLDARYYKDFNRLVAWKGWGPAHQFFLLFRAQPRSKAVIMRKWEMPFEGPGRLFLRGFLEYVALKKVAIVQITDGVDTTVVAERIALNTPAAAQ